MSDVKTIHEISDQQGTVRYTAEYIGGGVKITCYAPSVKNLDWIETTGVFFVSDVAIPFLEAILGQLKWLKEKETYQK